MRGVAARGERREMELFCRPEGLLAGSFQTNEEVGVNLEAIWSLNRRWHSDKFTGLCSDILLGNWVSFPSSTSLFSGKLCEHGNLCGLVCWLQFYEKQTLTAYSAIGYSKSRKSSCAWTPDHSLLWAKPALYVSRTGEMAPFSLNERRYPTSEQNILSISIRHGITSPPNQFTIRQPTITSLLFLSSRGNSFFWDNLSTWKEGSYQTIILSKQ